MARIAFQVEGQPVAQGSHRIYGGRIVDDNPKLRAWRDAVAKTARFVMGPREALDGPVAVEARFYFLRPKRMDEAQEWKATKPDLDKLCRAVGDALTLARVITDDSRIARWTAEKIYADREHVYVAVNELTKENNR